MDVMYDKFLGLRERDAAGSGGGSVGGSVGTEIQETAGTSFPLANGKIFKHTLSENETIVFDETVFRSGICESCELWLTMPSSVVSFSFPDDLIWVDGIAPVMDTGNTQYVLVLRWDGSRLLANLAYTLEMENAGASV